MTIKGDTRNETNKQESGKESLDTHEQQEPLSPELIAQEEAASKELVGKLTAEAAVLYNKLSAEGVDAGVGGPELTTLGDELEAIALEMNGLLEAHQLDLKALEETLQSAEALATDMPDVFSPEDIVAMKDQVTDKKEKKHHTKKVIEVAKRGQEKVKKHVELHQAGELQKEKEAKKRQSFVEGINKSGIDKKIIADGLESSHPEIVQKFVTAKLDALPANKRAEITADIDKQISALQTQIDGLADQFQESDALKEQRAKVESIKDKFPDQYTKATTQLDAKKQVELDLFIKDKAENLTEKMQVLEASKQQAETEFVKKEFGAELLDQAATDESVDLNKFSEGVAEKIQPEKLSLVEARNLPADMISAVVKKASGIEIAKMEADVSPIIFTEEYNTRRQEIFKEINELFDDKGIIKKEVLKRHDEIIKERQNPDNKKDAYEKERALWQRVKDAVAVVYARQGKEESPFRHASLEIGKHGMDEHTASINASRIRNGMEQTAMISIANDVASYMRPTTDQKGNYLKNAFPYAEKLAQIQEQAKEFSVGPFPNPEFPGSTDSAAISIQTELNSIDRNMGRLLTAMRDLQSDNGYNNHNRETVEGGIQQMQANLDHIKTIAQDYKKRKIAADTAKIKDADDKAFREEYRLKNEKANSEFGPILEKAIEAATEKKHSLIQQRENWKSKIDVLKKTLAAFNLNDKVYHQATAEASKPIFLGMGKRKVEVPVFSDTGEIIGTEKADATRIDELSAIRLSKSNEVLRNLNAMITEATDDLSNSKKAVLAEIDNVLNQANDKFRLLNTPSDVGKLKNVRDQIQQLNLYVN